MKWFKPQDVVDAFNEGNISRYQIRMNRNTARRRGYPERAAVFDEALRIIDEAKAAKE
ncbi:TPA: hypothetical protein M9Z14_003724 [Klebsiella pneumoniae subsp. pneumoniae]|uniref:Uncharacterized protein n=1 Tax=Klebsiella pneumoniae TaxID=573 RepID=A0A486DFZ7_KLEPN|nr:hypothetical protein [Klebsiella pneumoniae]HCD1339364.1 hypothetical protein [Klebsiella pneumoniae subsp. pneumoniae]VGH32433.1 Uncharacterised protein [Klebsiella pneumoniae]VGH40367.1 Uncharacterised protein [Klebsiella pneumoniae]VGH54148.1 Uncharacterised protein [Klebsiella pneumoniae]VGI69866.1 Uncharacterised protein [Klebsiella pneumoniae]